MAEAELRLNLAFMEIIEWITAKGAPKPLPPELYHGKVNDRWEFWLNPTKDELTLPAREGGHPAVAVPKFSAYLECNGFPAGLVDPAGGAIVCTEGYDVPADEALIKALVASRGGERLPVHVPAEAS